LPNSYFQFKQFRIEQDQAGMKVTTDGCLFGALIKPISAGTILDIGTGTGLLSLMLAQRTDAHIHAIEIGQQVAEQANDNFSSSPWASQLKVQHTSLQEFTSLQRYQQIVCNPPFFKGNSMGNSQKKNHAIHDDLLPMDELLATSLELLAPSGTLWLMYPPYEMSLFEKKAHLNGLYTLKWIAIRNTQNNTPIRIIASFSRKKDISQDKSMVVIRNEHNEYTEEFEHLLKPYYLHL